MRRSSRSLSFVDTYGCDHNQRARRHECDLSRRVEGERRTGQRHSHRLRHDSERRSPAGRAVSGIKHGKSVQRHFCRTETRGRVGSIEFARLEASAAGHRADFERERGAHGPAHEGTLAATADLRRVNVYFMPSGETVVRSTICGLIRNCSSVPNLCAQRQDRHHQNRRLPIRNGAGQAATEMCLRSCRSLRHQKERARTTNPGRGVKGRLDDTSSMAPACFVGISSR